MITPCINSIQHFIFQVMHTTLKNGELLKHFKIRKAFLILKCFNSSTFFNVVCITWKIKCWICQQLASLTVEATRTPETGHIYEGPTEEIMEIRKPFWKGPLVDIYETYQTYKHKEHSIVNECNSLTTNVPFSFIPENANTRARPVEPSRRRSFRKWGSMWRNYVCEVDSEEDISTHVETRTSWVIFADRHDNGCWYNTRNVNVKSVRKNRSMHVFHIKFANFKVRCVCLCV